MKLIFMALSLWASLAYATPVQVEAIPGKVKVMIEMKEVGTPLDILFVIDNSGSMQEYQQVVMDNAYQFIDQLSKGASDWKLGLISTSESEAPYGGFDKFDEISRTAPDSVGRFKSAVKALGLGGDVTEKVFTPIVGALTKNSNFLRQNAQLDIIVISDAEEQSKMPAADFVTKLKALGVNMNKTSLHAFISPVEFGCPSTDGNFSIPGSPYGDLSQFMTTDYKKLCDPNMAGELVALGSALGNTPKSGEVAPAVMTIPLPSQPDFYSIRVNYGTQEIMGGNAEIGWIWDNAKNEIVLGSKIAWQPQAPGTALEVTYVPYDWK